MDLLILTKAVLTISARMPGVRVIRVCVWISLCLEALCRWKPPLVLHFFPQSFQIISVDCTCQVKRDQ